MLEFFRETWPDFDFLEMLKGFPMQWEFWVSVILVVTFIFKIPTRIRNRWLAKKDRRLLEREKNYLTENILTSRRLFIPTHFYADPGGPIKAISKEQPKGLRKNLIRHLLKACQTSTHKYYLILADSGMGKTTFLVQLFLRYSGKARARKYPIRFLPMSRPEIWQEVNKIKNKERTILLLDAFDEDPKALEDYKKRESEIIPFIQNFRKVVITCRTQLFTSLKDEPEQTKDREPIQGFFHRFQKCHLAPFDDSDIKSYIRKCFPWYRPYFYSKRKNAWAIVEKAPEMMARPLILSFIKDLVYKGRTFQYTFEIYAVMIDKWLERDGNKWDTYEKYGSAEQFKAAQYQFHLDLAVHLYQNKDEKGGYFINYTESIPTSTGIQLKYRKTEEENILLKHSDHRFRSMLRRNEEGDYFFVHQTILEYFLAQKAVSDHDFLENLKFYELDSGLEFMREQFEQRLKTDENNYEARFGLGRIYNTRGDMKIAINQFEIACSLNPEMAIAHYYLGNVYSRMGDYKRAIEKYEKATDIKPSDHKAYNNMGVAYDNLGEHKMAIEKYERAIDIKPGDHEAYYNMGLTYNELGEYKRAIEKFEKAIKIKPNYHKAFNNMGVAHVNLGEHKMAIEKFEKAIDIKPGDHEAYYNMGLTYNELGEYKRAIEKFEKAIEIKPDFHEAYNNIGGVYNELGEYKTAIEKYERAIDIKPDDHKAYYNMGNVYFDLEDYKMAIEKFEKAIDIKPDDHEAYYNMGISYRNLGDYKRAIEKYQLAIDFKADYHEAYNNMGLAYSDLEDYKTSIEKYQLAIDIKPDKHEAYNNMGLAYYKLKNNQKAIECYQKAIDIKNDEPGYHFDLGWVALLLHQLERSEAAFLKAQSLGYVSYTIPMNIGHIQLLIGNKKEAMVWYRKAIAQCDDLETFWKGMQSDYSDIKMKDRGITEADYQKIIDELKNKP